MLIGLSAPTYDPDGAGMIRINAENAGQIHGGTRRQTKTATLDGGTSLYDTGFTRSDDTWTLRGPAAPGAVALIEHLSRSYQRIQVSTSAGMFETSVVMFQLDGADVEFQLSILGEL